MTISKVVTHIVRRETLSDADRSWWAQLCAGAGTDNIFAQDWFLGAAWRHCADDSEVSLLVVREDGNRWLGAIPIYAERRVGRWPIPHLRTWRATNQFLGSPLVLAGAEDPFWQAVLGHLDAHPGKALALYCEEFPVNDPVSQALATVCDDQGRAIRTLRTFSRPARLPDRPTISNDRSGRKALARLTALQRRLDRDHGPTSIAMHPQELSCDTWIDQFLLLEHEGWKGRAGSALACARSTNNLFHEVIKHGHARGNARLATLSIGEKPIAMTSWFEIGNHGYGFKTAYDENFRDYAPGRLLTRFVAEEVARKPSMFFDTCAPRGVISGPFWLDTRDVVDWAVEIGSPARRRILRAAVTAMMLYKKARNLWYKLPSR